MKKILMVCEAFGGGVFTYVSQLCNDMVNNFEIYLAYSVRKQTPKDYKELIDKRVNLIEIEDFGNLKKINKTIKRLREIENEIEPDIIHLHSSIAGGIGRLAYKGKHNSVLYTPHGFAHILLGKGIKSKVYFLIEKILGKTNSIILTCCESEDEEAKKFSKNTYYIETGINVYDLSQKLENIVSQKNDSFTVYTLGRACTQKQPELFNDIAKLVPEAKFMWIGSGELIDKLDAPNVVVTGWKPREEALAIAKGANVFVLCSLGEAIAMSLLENMYLKKLCLVSNTIGNNSVIKNEKNGYVCENPEDYALVIKKAMANFPKDICQNAYKDILEIFNTDIMKKKYIEYYNMLLKDCN